MTTSGSKLNQWAKTVLLAAWWKRLWRVLEESHKKFTNHSARKTTISKLKKANVERSDIVKVTGHRSVQSLDDYDEADQEEQRWKKSEGQFAASTTVAPLAPVNMNAPVPHTLAGPSMTASKENQFHFQVFKLRISPWIQPWWGLKNRPWWTRSPAVKCLPSLADRSELLSFQNCSPVLVNVELSLSRMIRVFCWLL